MNGPNMSAVDNILAITTNVSSDATRLTELEEIIARGLHTFIEVGKALMTIRDQKLWLVSGASTFEGYCRKRWNLGLSRAYQMISAAEVSTIVEAPIKNEAVARELVKLEPEEMKLVSTRVDLGTATAKQVREVVQQVAPSKPVLAYQADTEHKAVLARAQYRRMVDVLSNMRGLAWGLPHLDLAKTYAACPKAERGHWADYARESASALRKFAATWEEVVAALDGGSGDEGSR